MVVKKQLFYFYICCMAANGIIIIPNQPIQLYKQNPTDAELSLGMTAWAQTAYHKRLGNCFFVGPEYCHPVLNTDFMTFQFKAKTIGDNVLSQLSDSVLSSGANTSVSTDQLINSGEDFVGDGVAVSNVVVNSTTNTSTFVNNVASATTLDLDLDIFLATPNSYKVLSWKGAGEWKYNINTDIIYMDTPSPTTLFKEGALGINSYYKVTINVISVTAGNFQVKLGSNSIATINSVGTHVLYGQCLTTDIFTLQASSAFVGSIEDTIEVLELQTQYTIGVFDLDGVYQGAIVYDASGDGSLSIGNVFVNIEWGNFTLDCGKYVVGIFDGTAPCIGNMVTNGNFIEGAAGWILGTNMSIVSFHAELNISPADSALVNDLFCDIIEGRSYTLTYNVSDIGDDRYGNYTIPQVPGVVIRNFTNEGAVSITFTASSSSDILQFYCLENCLAQIDNVSLVCNDCVLDIEDADGLSECLCVCDAHDCTTLIKFSASRPTFGNFFDSNNVPMYFRIGGRLRNPENPALDFNPFKSTLDQQVQPSSSFNALEELATQLVPEWVHNSLTIALVHPILYIDGVSYKCTTPHAAEWGDEEVATGQSIVAKTNQGSLRNTY
jgi:hypothetical protein